MVHTILVLLAGSAMKIPLLVTKLCHSKSELYRKDLSHAHEFSLALKSQSQGGLNFPGVSVLS